jgi:uncharacterized protein YkwD
MVSLRKVGTTWTSRTLGCSALKLRTAVVVGLLILALLAGQAAAYRYGAPAPTGTLGLSLPTISQQFTLSAGEGFQRVRMWLNGAEVAPTANSATGLVSYTPSAPLVPGTYAVKIEALVSHPQPGWFYNPQISEFTFTVAAGAVAVLPEPDPEAQRALFYVNAYRTAAGLTPMVYRPSLGAAASGHARYLSANQLRGHDQDPTKPLFFGASVSDRVRYYGYTSGCGEVVAYETTAEIAIDRWIESLYHRIALVHPGNTEMGYGRAGQSRRINVINTGSYANSTTVVPWPFPGQTNVATEWSGRESPDPFRLYPGTQGPVGYTVTLTFGIKPKSLTLAAATLMGPDGKEVPSFLFSPVNDDKLSDTVSLIPRQPLLPATAYTARFAGMVDTGAGAIAYERIWSFTTAAEVCLAMRSRSTTYTGDSVVSEVRGSGFREGMKVFYGGQPVLDLRVVSATNLTFRLPANRTKDASDLVLVTPGGQETIWLSFFGDSAPAGNGVPAFSATTLTLSVSGTQVKVPGLVHTGGAAMVPVTEFTKLGLSPVRIPDLERTYCSAGGHSGDVMLGSALARVDGQTLALPLPVQAIGGVTHVPVVFAETLLLAAGHPGPPPELELQYFPDVPAGHPAFGAVNALAARGIVGGFPDGTFRPDAGVTRAQFAKMLVLTLGLAPQTGTASNFTDAKGHWAATQGFLQAAVTSGAIGGFPDGTFRPDAPVTRAQVVKMAAAGAGLTATAGIGSGGVAPYSDVAAALWYAGWVATAHREGLIGASSTFAVWPGGVFGGDLPATRAEAAAVLANLLGRKR